MKKLLLLVFALAGWCSASAQYRDSENLRDRLKWDDEKLHLMLDTRFDFLYGAGTSAPETRFNGQALRFWLQGEIVPGIRYRLRQRLNRVQSPLLDGLAEATDNAWVQFDIGHRKDWTVTVGKQTVMLGTYEYDYNGADLYLNTGVNSTFDNHKVGVAATCKFLGQSLSAQVFSPAGAGQFASEKWKSRALSGALLYVGSFFKGSLKTRTGYLAAQRDDRKVYHWLTTGWQLNHGVFTVEADYYRGAYNASDAVAKDLREVRDQSASLGLWICGRHWRPFLKAIWDNRRDNGLRESVYDRVGGQAAVEFYPFQGHKWIEDLRFHIAYTYTQTRFHNTYAGMRDEGRHQILVGMRWFFIAK